MGKALRGLAWEARFAWEKARRPQIHLHSALALPHVGWAAGDFFLHAHGTDVRTRQYQPQFRDTVRAAVARARCVFYSTPDLREHLQNLDTDGIFVPVPVPLPHPRTRPSVPARPTIFFTSRWDEVKGADVQIALADSLHREFGDSIELTGLNWGAYASDAGRAGVRLLEKVPHDQYQDMIAGADICIGQMSGVMGASELDALALNRRLVMPLNPDWYDGSDPSLTNVPVLSRDRTPSDIEHVTADIADALDHPVPSDTRPWVERHHSAEAALARVLAGYRTVSD